MRIVPCYVALMFFTPVAIADFETDCMKMNPRDVATRTSAMQACALWLESWNEADIRARLGKYTHYLYLLEGAIRNAHTQCVELKTDSCDNAARYLKSELAYIHPLTISIAPVPKQNGEPPGLTQIMDKLVVGKAKTASGQVIYLGFERVDSSNQFFWERYKEEARRLGWGLASYPNLIETQNGKLEFPDVVSGILGINEKQHQILIEAVRSHPKNTDCHPNKLANSLAAVRYGLDGMKFPGSCFEPPQNRRSYYVIYASTDPITKRFANADYGENGFLKSFGRIIMSVSGVTVPGMPTVTHTGIARNPYDFLDATQKYGGIAMILHGFAAAVWLKYFTAKKYMITKPLKFMETMFGEMLKKGELWVEQLPAELEILELEHADFDYSQAAIGISRSTMLLEALLRFYIPER